MENLITYSKTSPISDEKFDRLFEILEYSFPPCERGNYALHRSEFTRDEFRCMCYEPEGVHWHIPPLAHYFNSSSSYNPSPPRNHTPAKAPRHYRRSLTTCRSPLIPYFLSG